MVLWLSVTHTIEIQITDEQAFRTEAIDRLENAIGREGTDYTSMGIADAQSGGWNFVQELLLTESEMPYFAGVGDTDEVIYKPVVTDRQPS